MTRQNDVGEQLSEIRERPGTIVIFSQFKSILFLIPFYVFSRFTNLYIQEECTGICARRGGPLKHKVRPNKSRVFITEELA